MEYNLGKEGDDLYRELLELFEGQDQKQREALFARLTLTFMNEVGDASTIREIFATAKNSMAGN